MLILTGQIAITVSIGWAEPYDMFNPDDLAASDRDLEFSGGWFLNPICVNGDYPEVMKAQIARKSRLQGFNQSRLPEFTEEEKQLINRKDCYFTCLPLILLICMYTIVFARI